MRLLLERIDAPVVLLWFSDHAPEEKQGFAHVASQPFAVSRAMLGELEGLADDLVVATASAAALARGNEGMVFASGEAQASLQLLGPSAHDEAADAPRRRCSHATSDHSARGEPSSCAVSQVCIAASNSRGFSA